MVVSATCESPCRGCTDRKLHCHADCPEYLRYKDTLEKNRTAIHAQTEEGNFFRELKSNVRKKYEQRR